MFFRLREQALALKNLVLASPALSHINLEDCLFRAFSIAASPTRRIFRSFLSVNSALVRILFSWATSNLNMTSFTMWNCTLASLNKDLLHIFRSYAVLNIFVRSRAKAQLCCTGRCHARCTVSWKRGNFGQKDSKRKRACRIGAAHDASSSGQWSEHAVDAAISP